MSSERYDEAVREQKAERKKQVQKQVMILVIALVVIAVSCGSVFHDKGKKSEPKVQRRHPSSGLAGAISASYETFASEADPDASAKT